MANGDIVRPRRNRLRRILHPVVAPIALLLEAVLLQTTHCLLVHEVNIPTTIRINPHMHVPLMTTLPIAAAPLVVIILALIHQHCAYRHRVSAVVRTDNALIGAAVHDGV